LEVIVNKLADFMKRYPHGSDVSTIEDPILKRNPLRHFIPQHFHHAVQVEGLLMLAKDLGYSDEEVAHLRQRLEPSLEPVSVSLDVIHGEEGDDA
jgi:hypothetical protein